MDWAIFLQFNLIMFSLQAVFHQLLNNKTRTKMMYQSIPYHAPGVGMNLISNALLQAATNSTKYSISTSNYPLPSDKRVILILQNI